MVKILFVCHGNICRSPMAEYIFKKMIQDKGLNGDYYCESRAVTEEEIGNDIYPPAKRCLNAHSIPFDRHHATKITKQDYEEYDVIFVMDQSNLYRIHRMFDDTKGKIRMLNSSDVADPWYTGDFEKTYSDIVYGIERYLSEQ